MSRARQVGAWRAGAALILAGLAAADLLLLAGPVRRIPVHATQIFNEGWNALHAQRALGPGPLYPDATSLVSNNYPPLSFFVVGAVGGVVGDHIVAGRIVALVSFAVVALLMGAIVQRQTGSRTLGAFAGLCFVGFGAVHHPVYVAMNDPQWLAHAFMTAALWVLLGEGDGSLRRATVVGLMLAGGLVKHSLVALPWAATLWLAWVDRRGLLVWLGTCTLGIASVLALLFAAFGPEVFLGIAATPREVRLDFVWTKLWLWMPPLLPYLGGCALLPFLAPRDPAARLISIYAGVAAACGAIFLGGAGVSYNALFDLLIASLIGSVLAADLLARRAARRGLDPARVRIAAMLLLALPVWVAAPAPIARAQSAARSLPMREALVAADVAFIASRPGPALCSDPALCYWAGKAFEVDIFNAHQRWTSGALSWNGIEALLARHHFGVVQLPALDARGNSHLPRSRFEELALRYYEVARRSPSALFLTPRSATGP